jgi:predicted permease
MAFLSLSDLRDASRSLRRSPTVTISSITCLALGLAVTTDVSSAIDRALLRALPFSAPAELVTVYRSTPQFNEGPFSVPNYEDLARDTRSLSALVATAWMGSAMVTIGAGAEKLTAQSVAGELFPTLGVSALRGRLFMPADEALEQSSVVVLGEEVWRARFGADPAVVGQTLTIDGEARTVVGILPSGFALPVGTQVARADIWLPFRFNPDQRAARGNNFLRLMGRLAPGATPARAQEELTRLFDGIVAAHPELQGDGVQVVSLQGESVRTVRSPLLLLFGAVCIVLLISATNVASLLLARGVQRRREMAVRSALGGARWDVMRPIVAESLLLTTTGLVLGILLAWLGIRSIGAVAATRVPQVAGLTMDVRVIAFAVVLSLLAAGICGAVPAWRSAGVDPQEALRSGRGGADRSQQRLLGVLVVGEVAMSLVLLISAGLVMRGFADLLRQDPGFDASRLLTLEASVSPARYHGTDGVRRFLDPALAAIEQIPGVERAAGINLMPYVNWGWNSNVRYEGRPGDDPARQPLVEYRTITPGFFSVTQQKLVAGRLLGAGDDDRQGAPRVVVVNEALVRRDFPTADPIGKRFHLTDTSFATIVGVVKDIKNFGPYGLPRPEMYWTYLQGEASTVFPIIVRARTAGLTSLVAQLRAALKGVDAEVAIADLKSMSDIMSQSVGRPRFYLTLLGVFAAVAVLLALAGAYGVMSYAVAQRTREFGIRSALGSTPAKTVAMVTGQGMRLVGAGLALGIAASFGVTRLLRSLLFGVSPLDVRAWLVATALLTGAGLLATLIPALRSSRVDPVTVMRTD